MPPKRKAAAKKVIRSKEVPVEDIDPNEEMVDKDDDVNEDMSEPKFTTRRPFQKAAESLVDDEEKLRMLEDRMSNSVQSKEDELEDEKMPKVSKVKSKSKSKKDKTDNDVKEKKTRKRAISEDRPTKTGEKLVKNNRKRQEKVESEILSSIEPIKKTRRANSVDRLAAEIPSVVTNIKKKNQKSTKNEDDDKQKTSKRVLKKTESIPEPIINEKKTKTKRTAKKILDSEEDIPVTEKPTVKQKGLKKEQVFKKFTEDTLEIQTGTEALKISKLKKEKPAKRGVKKEIIKYTNNSDSDNNVVKSDDCSDHNSDSDVVVVKPLKSILKKHPDSEEEFDENSNAELHVDNNEEDKTKDEDQTEDVEDQAKDVEDAAIVLEGDEVGALLALTDSDFNEDEEPIFVEKKPTKKVRKLKQPIEEEKVVKLPRSRKAKVNSFEHDVLPDVSSPEGTNIETEVNPKKRKTKAKAKK